MSPGTLAGLGPHTWESSIDVRGDRLGRFASLHQVATLSFVDEFHWEERVLNDDRIVRHEIRFDAATYRRQSDGARWSKVPSTPAASMVLQRTIEPWERAVGPLMGQLGWRLSGPDKVDGRAARLWTIELVPPAAPDVGEGLSPDAAASLAGRDVDVLALSGKVWVDVETGNRLLVEFDGRFTARRTLGNRDPTDEVTVSYRERRTLGAPKAVVPPSDDLVVDRSNPLLRPRAAAAPGDPR